MILARMLTKADFGIAATFAMVISLLEFSSKLGVARFVIRDKEGDQPEFLAAAHLVQAVAAVLSALLIAVAAWPMALLFKIGEHWVGILSLAIIPLLQGFSHLDTRRFERDLRFIPSVVTDAIPQLGITLIAWPVALWLPDYRSVLLLLVMKALFSFVASHWLAEQPYRWKACPDYVKRMVRFGWPLVLNGLLMFAVLRGDQFVVASFYSMEDLGPYAAAAALTFAPTLFFTRVFASIMLPIMAKVQDDTLSFVRRYSIVVGFVCSFSAAYAVAVILGAEVIMKLAFGKKYAGTGIILAWLVAANAFRNIRLAPAIAAIAKGDSINQMVSNLCGGLSLVPALTFAIAGQPVWMIACSGLIGELAACWISYWKLAKDHQVPVTRSLWPTVLVGGVVIVAGLASYLTSMRSHPVLAIVAAVVGSVLAGGGVALALKGTRAEVVRFLREARRSSWREWLPLAREAGVGRKPAAT